MLPAEFKPQAVRELPGPAYDGAMKLRTTLAAQALATVLGLAWAGVCWSSGAGHGHVHGQARLDTSITGTRLALELHIPMEALVGFERAPRNDEERQRLDRARQSLLAATLFRPNPEAACRPGIPSLSWSGGAGPAEGPDEEHTDAVLQVVFECADPSRLKTLEVGAFDAFSRLRRIEARIIGPQGSAARVVQRNKRTLELSR